MCSLSEEKTVRATTDVDSLRSEIRDKSVKVIDVRKEEEYKQKTATQLEARNELDNWYNQKTAERQAKSKQNKEEEWAYLQTREEHKKSKNPWEKIVDNVEINPNKYLGNKDISRMRQAMLARKGDLKEGRN